MIKRIASLVLGVAAILAAQGLPQTNPPKPVGGQKVTWTFDGFKRESLQPVMLLVVYASDTVLVELVRGERSGEVWNFSYTQPEGARFAQFKIEDNVGPLADDEGFFFGTPVYNEAGVAQFDASRLYAALYLGTRDGRPDRAQKLLELELENYPMNWEALVTLRWLELVAGRRDETSIANEIDSLIAAKPDSLEALYFAALDFFLTSKGLQDKPDQIMLLCAQGYPSSPYWVREQYIIYDYISQSPERLGDYERLIFPLLKDKARESGYFLLMLYALNNPRLSRVEELTAGLVEEFPSSSLAPAFAAGMLGVKYRERNAQWVAEVEKWEKRYPKDTILNLELAEYYKDRDWKTALRYYRNALRSSRGATASILFGEAAASKDKDLKEATEALRNAILYVNGDLYRRQFWWLDFNTRRQMLVKTQALLYKTLGWVSFKSGDYGAATQELLASDSLLVTLPGYDEELYKRLLKTGEKAGNLQARKTALLNLILLNPEDLATQAALQEIYQVEYGTTEGFNEWLTEETQKVSLRQRMNLPLPNFTLLDLKGDTVSINRFQDKVVVINFWATWCAPCREEMPELNNLVKDFQGNDKVVFLGVTKESPETISGFLDSNVFLYGILLDNGTVSQLLKITDIPTHMVVDAKGVLQFEHVGALPYIREILTAEINALLEEQD